MDTAHMLKLSLCYIQGILKSMEKTDQYCLGLAPHNAL